MIQNRILRLALLLIISAIAVAAQDLATSQVPDVPYVPTSQAKVDAMLALANVTKADIVYDLGSGDGRIPITAAKKYGARGVGVDINASLVEQANKNAADAKVADKVKFINADLFKTDFSEATVVTLYLLPDVNLRLRPILWKQLKPGTRIVSHSFTMGDWKPERTETVEGATLYFWRVPTKAERDKMKLTDADRSPTTMMAPPKADTMEK